MDNEGHTDDEVPDEVPSNVVLEDFLPLGEDGSLRVVGGVEVEQDFEYEKLEEMKDEGLTMLGRVSRTMVKAPICCWSKSKDSLVGM